jgi:heterodisulfide reductase subunit C
MHEYNSLDHEFKKQVASKPGGERVTNCYLCGTCTAGCPVSRLEGDYNPRRIMKKVLLGLKKEVLESPEIWQCSQCHVCVAHCPQDVRFADVIRVLRQLAQEEGYASK